MKYTAIILSIVLISVCFIIYEADSAYAMRTIKSNLNEIIYPDETSITEKGVTQVLRDSKATSFVPTFKSINNIISESYKVSEDNKIIHHNRIHHLN